MRARWLGRVDYAAGLRLQEEALAAHGVDGDVLLLLEHDPVYTTGRGGREEHLPAAAAGPVHRVSRGGDATFHGPGQLVGYPVVDLRARGGDVRAYLRALEDAVVQTCAAFGLAAGRLPGRTGAWVGGPGTPGGWRKIASIGVGVRRGITQHGFALNVSVDLAAFAAIVPCGIEGVVMTSLAHERVDPVPGIEAVARVAAAEVPLALAGRLGSGGAQREAR